MRASVVIFRFTSVTLVTFFKVAATLVVVFSEPTHADEERFCLKKLNFAPLFQKTIFSGIEGVLETKTPEHDIFFLKAKDGDRPARLINGIFVPVTEEFPTKFDSNSIIETPDGEIFGLGGFLGSRSFYRFNDAAGHFVEMAIESPFGILDARDIVWSSPFNAPLLLIGGSENSSNQVLILEGNQAVRLEGVSQWVTHVTDFPDIKLTLLATEELNQIYIVDAEKTLYELEKLNLGDWRYVSQAFFLPDPPRLLLEAREALGSFRGNYLIRLQKSGGAWKPALEQNWSNLMEEFPDLGPNQRRNGRREYDPESARYFFYGQKHKGNFQRFLGFFSSQARKASFGLYLMGEKGFEKVDETDVALFNTLPKGLKFTMDRSSGPSLYASRTLRLRDWEMSVGLMAGSVRVVADDGNVHELDGSDLGESVHRSERWSWPLNNRGEVLLFSGSTYFLLKDRKRAGAQACS